MVKILAKSANEIGKVDMYLMTSASDIATVKDIEDGEIITPTKWVEYVDVKDDDSETTVFAFMDDAGKAYATTSKTFKKSFMDMWDLFDGESFSIEKTSGVAKSGRPFINCVLHR